jgi:flavin reductase (DIM6/NTAB) family NADH-FMN oxidoreductase RutF
VATPVTAVTAMSDGLPHGTTARALAALSMQPPMVLVPPERGSELLSLIQHSPRFGVDAALGATASATSALTSRVGLRHPVGRLARWPP